VYEPLASRGGSVSAEHGIGLEKQPWLALSRSPAELELMHRLKQTLDPKGILNPGRVLPA
jgi:FAD/FMN-containing dehydrogenase